MNAIVLGEETDLPSDLMLCSALMLTTVNYCYGLLITACNFFGPNRHYL